VIRLKNYATFEQELNSLISKSLKNEKTDTIYIILCHSRSWFQPIAATCYV
jgi:hypothetical protein